MKVESTLQTYCIIDKQPIPYERAIRKSNTCRKECSVTLAALRRAQVDMRKCRHCAKPSTPLQRKAFLAFKREHPEYREPKIGRPKQKAASA